MNKSTPKAKIGSTERLSKDVNAQKPRPQPKPYQPITFPFRVRFKAKSKQIWGVTKKFSILAWKHPRETITIITTFMKIKGDQTSTRAGIALLITILGLFGLDINPDLFTENVMQLIEGVIAVFGSVTALWAIFKDDDKEDEEAK